MEDTAATKRHQENTTCLYGPPKTNYPLYGGGPPPNGELSFATNLIGEYCSHKVGSVGQIYSLPHSNAGICTIVVTASQ